MSIQAPDNHLFLFKKAFDCVTEAWEGSMTGPGRREKEEAIFQNMK